MGQVLIDTSGVKRYNIFGEHPSSEVGHMSIRVVTYSYITQFATALNVCHEIPLMHFIASGYGANAAANSPCTEIPLSVSPADKETCSCKEKNYSGKGLD